MHTPFNVWRQYYLPQHTLSWIAGKLAYCQVPWFKNWAIQRLIRLYGVNVSEALDPLPENYASFHDFFTRHLKPELRPIDSLPAGICSPCDAVISQIAKIKENTLIQAKGRTFTLEALLGESEAAKSFINGHYVTLYLAPQDYHRVHMPFSGTLQALRYIPGKLFSVNPLTTQHVDQLFARNERLIATFNHPAGSFAVVMVGAMLVGSLFTRWSGQIFSSKKHDIYHIQYANTPKQHIALDKGEEMGYFSLGSTVILLMNGDLSWEQTLAPQSRVQFGQRIGQFC